MRSSLTDPSVVPTLAPGLMRLASRLAGGGTEAEDLVQATWVRALEHGGTVSAPQSWLRQVLTNEGRMQLRARMRRDERERAQGQTHQVPHGVDEVVHCLEIARVIDRLLQQLDEDVRMVVRERYFGGSSAAEIARRHRIPAGTVRWRLKSGLDRLREELDAHYGGRRALWAGGIVSMPTTPTLLNTAASQPLTDGRSVATTAKGLSAMSIKIMVLAGLAVAGSGVAWVATSDADLQPPTQSSTEASAVEVAADNTASPRASKQAESTPAETSDNKRRWEAQRAAIRHARQAAASAKAAPSPHQGGMAWHRAEEGHHEACARDDESCAGGFAKQMTAMVESCKDFMNHADPSISMTARLIGAPGVGVIVESVELSGDDAPEDLRECLTETMYTLDLGTTEDDFEQEMTVMIGGAVELDALSELDDETRAAVEAALAQHDGEGEAQLMFLGEAE